LLKFLEAGDVDGEREIPGQQFRKYKTAIDTRSRRAGLLRLAIDDLDVRIGDGAATRIGNRT